MSNFNEYQGKYLKIELMKKEKEIKKLVNKDIGVVTNNIRSYHENERLDKKLEVIELLERGFLNRQIFWINVTKIRHKLWKKI